MHRSRLSGFTLIEMIITIVVVGVGLAGVLVAFSTTIKSSSDPMVRKQVVAIAEGMMEEITLKPYVDPGTGGSIAAGSCDRSAADDMQDYVGYTSRSVCDVDGTPVAGLATYRVSVVLDTAAALGSLATNVTKITVTVSNGGAQSFSLVGWRTKYAS